MRREIPMVAISVCTQQLVGSEANAEVKQIETSSQPYFRVVLHSFSYGIRNIYVDVYATLISSVYLNKHFQTQVCYFTPF